jgi:cytochrome P450
MPSPGRFSFPLGNLGEWNDLLELNRRILSTGAKMVVQWTFHKQSVAIVNGPALYKVFHASSSRQLQPPLLSLVGMYHIKHFFGNQSVGVTEGKKWSTTRKAIGKSLKPMVVRSLFGQINECAGDCVLLLQHLVEQNQNNSTIDIAPIFHALALDVVCESIFDGNVGAIASLRNGKYDPIVESFRFAEDEMVRRTSSFHPLDWVYCGCASKKNRQLKNANKEIRKMVKHVITKRIERGFKKEGKKSDGDLLGHLLFETSEKNAPNIDSVIDNVVTMMWAGHDTSAAALSFAIHLLSTTKNIHIQTDLRTELNMLAEVNNGKLSAEDIRNASLLHAVVLETLRLHPPTLWTNRGLQKDLIIKESGGDDIVLKAGSGVFAPIWAVHRSPINWPDRPNEFVPSRFLNVPVADYREKFFPFGAGRRICPGASLAPFEIKVVLACLIRQFEFLEPGIEYPVPSIRAHGMVQQCLNNYVRIKKM